MGYTHYWKEKPLCSRLNPTWRKFIEDARTLLWCEESLELAWRELDIEDAPLVSYEGGIRFNGIGLDGHETFVLERIETEFGFCKTAYKPYDKLVTAVLSLAKYHTILYDVSSDGEPHEWDDGVEYASKILGIKIPHPFNPQYKHKGGVNMTLHEIPLTDSTKILITKDTINEKTFGQIRVWTKPKGSDDFIPTKKGVAFDLSKTSELVQGLLTLEDEGAKA